MKAALGTLIVILAAPALAMAQDRAADVASARGLHGIDARSPQGLRELFRYTGDPLPLLSSHRGGAGPGFPENCIATFENTIRHTYSVLEIDLRYSKDGQLVLHHDPTLERTTTGTGPVADRTLQELKALRLKDSEGKVTEYQIPTLEEAFDWARGKTVLILDKKEVPVEACVRQIEAHHAEAYAMLMAYSFQDVKRCHELNKDIMMEVMIGDRARFRGFDQTGVPWNRIVAFVGHTPPEDPELLRMIHAKGACCMAGTSRNLDLQLRREGRSAALEQGYRALLQKGIDLIETDLPVQVGSLLYPGQKVPGTVIPARPSAPVTRDNGS